MRQFIVRFLKRIFRESASNFCQNPRFGISMSNLLDVMPHNPVILEAGGHDGTNTVDLATIPGAIVHTFEPVPSVYKRLSQRITGLSNVASYNLALGSKPAKQEMYLSGGRNDASSSLSKPQDISVFNSDITFHEKVEVTVDTIDAWSIKNNVSRLDFLWLDMQGHELEALKGGQSLLDSVTAIYTEVNLLRVYEGIPLYHEVWEWIREFGFTIDRIDFSWPDQGEVLFVRSKS